VQVLRFLLRFPAELCTRITRATEQSVDPSSDAAHAGELFLGHDKVRRGRCLRKTWHLKCSVAWQQTTAPRSTRALASG